jgi:hypothetical protein
LLVGKVEDEISKIFISPQSLEERLSRDATGEVILMLQEFAILSPRRGEVSIESSLYPRLSHMLEGRQYKTISINLI